MLSWYTSNRCICRSKAISGHASSRTTQNFPRFGNSKGPNFGQSWVNKRGTYNTYDKIRTPLASISALGVENPNSTSEQGKEVKSFDWHRQWYPLGIVEDLKTDRPQVVQVLGKDLVVWADGQGEWHAFEDKCPHRGVPLSEGRIETDGTLQCSYHGWRFKGDGTCTTVPQTLNPEAETKACKSTRSSANTYPTQVADGLLFGWLHSGPEAYVESAMNPPKFLDPGEGEKVRTPWVCRDMPIQWELLVENVSDPAHVPFSHHGVQGDRNKPTMPNFTTLLCFDDQKYAVSTPMEKNPRGGYSQSIAHLDLPCAYTLSFAKAVETDEATEALKGLEPGSKARADVLSALDKKLILTINTHVVPITPAYSRLYARFEYPGLVDVLPLKLKVNLRPVWHDHLERNAIFDGDLVFLHRQSQHMTAGRLSTKDYYMPAPADLPIENLWKWMKKYSPGGVDFYPDVRLAFDDGSIRPRTELLDRYTQHVKGCKACSAALKNVRRGITACTVAMASAFIGLAGMLGAGQAPVSAGPIGSVLVAAFALAVSTRLKGMEREFTFSDYVHADK